MSDNLFADEYADTAIICKKGKIVKYSSYILSRLSDYFAAALRFNPEKMREDAEKLGLKNIRFVVNIPDFPAEFVKSFLRLYVTICDNYNLPLFLCATGCIKDLKFWMLFVQFWGKYISKDEINYDELLQNMIRENGGQYSSAFTDVIIKHCLDKKRLVDFIAHIYKNHDKKIYAKIPDDMKEAIEKYGRIGPADICRMIYHCEISISDLHELTRKRVIKCLKDPEDDIYATSVEIMKEKTYVMREYMKYLEQKCGISNSDDNNNEDCDELCDDNNYNTDELSAQADEMYQDDKRIRKSVMCKNIDCGKYCTCSDSNSEQHIPDFDEEPGKVFALSRKIISRDRGVKHSPKKIYVAESCD